MILGGHSLALTLALERTSGLPGCGSLEGVCISLEGLGRGGGGVRKI